MPNGDYQQATADEKRSVLVWCLISFLYGKGKIAGFPSHGADRKPSPYYGWLKYAKQDRGFLRGALAGLSEDFIYNGRDPMCRKLADWYDSDNENRAKREAEDTYERLKAEAVARAREKLTEEEAEAVGL